MFRVIIINYIASTKNYIPIIYPFTRHFIPRNLLIFSDHNMITYLLLLYIYSIIIAFYYYLVAIRSILIYYRI